MISLLLIFDERVGTDAGLMMEGAGRVLAKRTVSLVVLSLVAIVAPPWPRGKWLPARWQESHDTTAHWIAQYRQPRSLAQTGNYLTLSSFNSISIISPDIFVVGADLPDWSSVDDRGDPIDLNHRYTVVEKTTDGGKTWEETSLGSTGLDISALNSIAFANSSVGAAVGVDSEWKGVICNTTDGGASWRGARLAFKQIPTYVWLRPSGVGWMAGVTSRKPKGKEEADDEGGPSNILGTKDFGRSWFSQKHVPVSINTLFFVDDRTGWAGGNPTAIYHTSDGGRTWDKQRTGLEPGAPQIARSASKQFSITGLSFTDLSNGCAAVRSEGGDREGWVIGTTNGGKTWSRLWTTNGERPRAVSFVNPMEGWLSTDDGHYVYHTRDSGHSWLAEPIDFVQNVPLYQIAASDPWHVWAVGGGGIFRRVSE